MSLKRKAERQITADNPGLSLEDDEDQIVPVEIDHKALEAARLEREAKRAEEAEKLNKATCGAFKKIITSATGLERDDEPKKTEEKEESKEKVETKGVAAIDFTAAPSAAPGFPTIKTNLAPTASSDKKLSFSFSSSENRMAQIAKQAAAKGATDEQTTKEFSPLAPAFVSYVEKEKEKQQSVPAVLSPSEQKTGQENEETILEVTDICLHQLNPDKSSWNERGTGVIKINKHNNGSHRILMWREKTHNLLLNEPLATSSFKLTPGSSQRAFTFLSATNDSMNTYCLKIKKAANIPILADLLKKITEIIDASAK